MPQTSSPPDAQLVIAGADSLEDRLREIHNFIYANDGIKQYARVMDEVVKLIYAKLIDERKGRRIVAEADGGQVVETVREVFREGVEEATGLAIFQPGDSIGLSDASIAFAIKRLGSEKLRNQDPKGAAFQTILGPTLRGELGQFFTPDPVKELLVRLTGPVAGEVVGDPASGSAGLLLDVLRAEPSAVVRASEVDTALARLARLNLFLAGVAEPDVLRIDALQPLKQLDEASGGKLGTATCDVVVSNPPFGSKGRISDTAVLNDLPYVTQGKKAVAPELLFIERIIQLLRPGGRAGIVVPLGVLSNPSTRHVRSLMRHEGRIYASVRLPAETFQPTGNSVNAAIVFFEKGRPHDLPYPVFRAISSAIGYDHRGRPSPSTDIPQICESWDLFRDRYRSEFSWMS